MGENLSLLKANVPPWFQVVAASSVEIVGTATASVGVAARGFAVDLVVRESGNAINVSENSPGSIFPAACPERHINSDGTFCLGRGVERIVADDDTAKIWWGLLKKYLELQRTVARTRKWPPRQALAHGAAAEHHETALRLAEELGVLETYYEVLEGERRWITQIRLRKGTLTLLNGRAPCPVGCRHKSGHVRLRRDCSHKEMIARLIHAESERRRLEAKFMEEWRTAGGRCCGQMDGCALAS